MPPRGHSCLQLPFTTYGTFFSGTMEQWNGTSQIMERPGTVRPAALWIALLVTKFCFHFFPAVLPLLPSLWDVEDVMYVNGNYDHFYEATTLSAPTTPRTLKSVGEENHGLNSLPVPAEEHEDPPINQRSAIAEIRDFHIEWQKVQRRVIYGLYVLTVKNDHV